MVSLEQYPLVPSRVLDFDIYYMKICEDQIITSYFQQILWYRMAVNVGEDAKVQELSPHLGEPDKFFIDNEELDLYALHICGDLVLSLDFIEKVDEPDVLEAPEILRIGKNDRTSIVSG